MNSLSCVVMLAVSVSTDVTGDVSCGTTVDASSYDDVANC